MGAARSARRLVADNGVVIEMTDEDRKAILDEARATLERTAKIGEPDYLSAALARPVEHPNDRDRRELAKRDAEWAKQRQREAAKAPAPQEREDWLRARLKAERRVIIEAVEEAFGKERRTHRRELEDSVRALRFELADARETISEFRRVIASSNRSGGEVGRIWSRSRAETNQPLVRPTRLAEASPAAPSTIWVSQISPSRVQTGYRL